MVLANLACTRIFNCANKLSPYCETYARLTPLARTRTKEYSILKDLKIGCILFSELSASKFDFPGISLRTRLKLRFVSHFNYACISLPYNFSRPSFLLSFIFVWGFKRRNDRTLQKPYWSKDRLKKRDFLNNSLVTCKFMKTHLFLTNQTLILCLSSEIKNNFDV